MAARRAINLRRLNPVAAAPRTTEAPSYTSLHGGDLITLRAADQGMKRSVLGSMAERIAVVENEGEFEDGGTPPSSLVGGAHVTRRFDDCVFRICSKLNYRARSELNKIMKAVRQSADPEQTKRELGLEQARMRAHSEATQNEEALGKLHKGVGVTIKYGDVVQLEHRKSCLFLAMHKTPAPVNSNCRKVSLKPGSFAAHRILPRFKVRSIGSPVYANDEIVFHSVKFEPMMLGGSSAPKDMLPLPEVPQRLGIRLPAALRHGTCFEVNGSMDTRSFVVKMYARLGEHDRHSLLSSLHRFRLFHPEENAFVSASGDADKGEVLDARNAAKQVRTRQLSHDPNAPPPIPAHIPYLKAVGGDVSNPANFSAKAVWRFENLDRSTAGVVKWHTPLRLRHVASDKYLSVDSLQPTKLRPSILSAATGADSPHAPSKPQENEVKGDDHDGTMLYNAALVADANETLQEGALGSPSSLIFHLVPTDVTTETLKNSVSSIRLEHHTAAGFTLFLVSPREPKPPLAPLATTDDGEQNDASKEKPQEDVLTDGKAGGGGTPRGVSKASVRELKRGGRLLFSTQSSSVDVLKLMPITSVESHRLDSMCSRLRLFRLYTNHYMCFNPTGVDSEPPPVEMCEAVVAQCLALIDDMRKGDPPPPRHATIADAMKEANATLPAQFATFFSGEPDPRMQRIAIEVKVLDAVFEAALAPYNRALNSARPFQFVPANDQPKALAKFLYVSIQRGVSGNSMAQEYFSGRSSRAWFPPSSSLTLDSMASADEAQDESPVPVPPLEPAVRRWALWPNMIISQGEDSLGAAVTLAQLLAASETIVAKLVNTELMTRFKGLIKRCGPEPRLINLFTATCNVAGKPIRVNQEMCVRTLWMNLPDRYGIGVTFHECDDVTLPDFGPVTLPSDAEFAAPPVKRAPDTAPKDYLGRTKRNEYGPVCVGWTGADVWSPDCGKFFWSAKELGIPVVSSHETGDPATGGVGKVELVHLESLLWVLEPEMLCGAVTGKSWKPVEDGKGGRGKKQERSANRTSTFYARMDTFSHSIDGTMDVLSPEKRRAAKFKKQVQLATYVVAQIKLLTRMCSGRSFTCVSWLERDFSYDCLLNMASNPRLPLVFRAAVLDFAQALYVDRFPQMENRLPELLWIFNERPYAGLRKSNTPVLQPLTLGSEAAFPYFFLPPQSSMADDPNPILSFKNHFKFFLLRSLCNDIINSFGESGRMVHSLAALNDLGGAALRGQQGLLDFGFQSTYAKLKELCAANGKLLDGRSDLDKVGKVFDPPERRYQESGGSSAVVTKMKREIISLFLDVADLRANYRLAKFLFLFKTHAQQIKFSERPSVFGAGDQALRESMESLVGADADFSNNTSSPRGGGQRRSHSSTATANWDAVTNLIGSGMGLLHSATGESSSYLLGRTDADRKKLYEDFEALFPGGSDDAAKLDLAELANKPDMDQALVDCLMYEDDSLMEAALALLERTYGQRRKLLYALQDATLLPSVDIPVYGDVHTLRSSLNDTLFQARTATSWGVKSRISGPFNDSTFGAIMANVDKLLVFLHSASSASTTDSPATDERPSSATPHLSFGSGSKAKPIPKQRGSQKKGKAKKKMAFPEVELSSAAASGVGSVGGSDDDAEDDANFQGFFRETGLDGQTYECRRLWSLDVAAKWGRGRGDVEPVNKHHQDILHACNLQAVLAEGLAMDHEIAWKGSICTVREKEESERRLTLVKRALLQLSIFFVDGNSKNQEALFQFMETLQTLSTPPDVPEPKEAPNEPEGVAGGSSLRGSADAPVKVKANRPPPVAGARKPRRKGGRGSGGLSGGRLTARMSKLMKGPPLVEDAAWPRTVAELSQDLIMRILSRNEALCDRVKRPLIELFASLVDTSDDCSGAPTLELLFILARPHERPIRDNQSAVAEILLNHSAFPRLFKAVSSVVQPEAGGLKNPSRLINLVRAVMENKNEYAASQLMQYANLTIDATCSALTALVMDDSMHKESDRAVSDGIGVDGAVADEDEEYRRGPSPSAAKKVLCRSLGSSFVNLLAEQVFLLPMNTAQAKSEALWDFLSGPAALNLEALASVGRMSPSELKCCEDLFDVLEHVLEVLVRLGLLDDVFHDDHKATCVSNMCEDVEMILMQREHTPESLRQAFSDALLRTGQKAGLDREGFKQLVLDLDEGRNNSGVAHSSSVRSMFKKDAITFSSSFLRGPGSHKEPDSPRGLSPPSPPPSGSEPKRNTSPSPAAFQTAQRYRSFHFSSFGTKTPQASSVKAKREAQLERAFDLADADGSGYVDLYEFIALYFKVTKSPGSDGMGQDTVADLAEATGLKNEGHALSMRAGECAERILAIGRSPSGAPMLHPPRFTRADKYPRRKRGGDGSGGIESTYNLLTNLHVLKGNGHHRSGNKKSYIEPPLRTVEQRLDAFKATVLGNTRVLQSLQRRLYSVVTVLENGVPGPSTKNGRNLTIKSASTKEQVENALCSAVAVGWKDVTRRFVKYCGEHFYDDDDEEHHGRRTVKLILETWMTHLVKARSIALEEDGVTPAESVDKCSVLVQLPPHDLDEEAYEAYREKQSTLNALGVTEILAKVISSLDDISVGGLPDLALEVFIELLNGGCQEAADSLYHFLVRVDTEGRFLKHLSRRLNAGLEGLADAKSSGAFGRDSGGAITSEVEEVCHYVITTTRFMQLACEGHNLKFQNLLRAQPMYAGQSNLVKKVVEALVLLCDSTLAVTFFHDVELNVVSQLLALLVELMQGPCPGNQEVIVESEAIVAVNNIIPAFNPFDREMTLADPSHMDIRGQSCVLLAACLEGREDFDCHRGLTLKLEGASLTGYQELIEQNIREMRVEALDRLFEHDEEKRLATLKAALVAVVTVKMELRQERKEQEKAAEQGGAAAGGTLAGQEEFEEEDDAASEAAGSDKGEDEDEELKGNAGASAAEHSSNMLDKYSTQPLVGIVEVAWKGQIERNVFAMPFEVEYLTAGTKAKFLEEVDLSTTEKRMSELMRNSDSFIAEMRLIHDMAEVSAHFRVLHHQMPTFKIYLYALVMLLNLNVIMAPSQLKSPAQALMRYVFGSLNLDPFELASLGITTLLFLLVLVGYLIIIGHLATIEVPMVIMELEGAWSDAKKDAPSDPSAWGTYAGSCALAVIFVGMHFINYEPVPGWYLAIALLTFPIFVSSFRATIVRPTSPFQRSFCIWYDVVTTRAFLRNHALLAICSILGMSEVEFFTLELLDVVNISSVISDIIKSVTAPGKALIYTLYLFIITSVIYASFGMAYFSDQLLVPKIIITDDDADDSTSRRLSDSEDPWMEEGEEFGYEMDEEEWPDGGFERNLKASPKSSSSFTSTTSQCASLFSCTLFFFYQGMSEAGNLKGFLRVASPGTYNYIPRIVYDSVYFIWVGIVLVNIITGLMVDTFSEIRGDKAAREDTLETDCFVCGMQRDTYEDLGLKPGSPTFADHLEVDHNLWTYIYFVAYLKAKDPTEYNGIESYVRGKIDNNSLEWVPSRTCFLVQDQGKRGNAGVDAAAAAQAAEENEAALASASEQKIALNSIRQQLDSLYNVVMRLTAAQEGNADE